jgi:hypothetical protein
LKIISRKLKYFFAAFYPNSINICKLIVQLSLITTDTIKGCMKSDESSSGYKLTFYLRILDGNHIDNHTGGSCMITILITAQKEEHNFLVKVCDKEFDLSKNVLLNRDDYKDMYDHIYTQIQDKISNTWSKKMSLTI